MWQVVQVGGEEDPDAEDGGRIEVTARCGTERQEHPGAILVGKCSHPESQRGPWAGSRCLLEDGEELACS